MWVAGIADPIVLHGKDYVFDLGAKNPKSKYMVTPSMHLSTPFQSRGAIINWLKTFVCSGPAFQGADSSALFPQPIHFRDPGTDIRQDLRQQFLHLIACHAGADARIVQQVQDVLVVDVEETHLDFVIEHRPGKLVVIVDRARAPAAILRTRSHRR